ncbi:unnamed protein product [Effrenium voratum]|uniref:Uncharacterized protein n=1 Tax=Effrenium voratum TaxID=2562239 RepID=A0AA36ISM7_9DINO|nr:unnamed protein product [Effrenium voratum]CAJ1453153.1 unnamed protein product [Effrenium voratum]
MKARHAKSKPKTKPGKPEPSSGDRLVAKAKVKATPKLPFRTLSYQQHQQCFAPARPSQCPEGYRASDLPRVAWLPPGWGQVVKDSEDGSRKMYVAPPELNSKIMTNKLNVELAVGRKLKPMDEHGVHLGEQCIRKWPKWLPLDWRIGYLRTAGGVVKPCFLSPDGTRFMEKKAVLAHKTGKDKATETGGAAPDSTGSKPRQGRFLKRGRARASQQRKGPKDSSAPVIFRSFTPQQLLDCFGPPLGSCTTPPSHWPEDLKVSELPRISWLPPGWGQAEKKDGHRRKLYVAPPELGGKVVFHRENVEVLVGRKLRPMDQTGVDLGEDCVKVWPSWLPKDWQIGYFKAKGGVKPCFLHPDGTRHMDRQAVLARLNPDRKPEDTKAAEKKMKLGPFAHRQAQKLQNRVISSLRAQAADVESEEEDPNESGIFRTFTYQELLDCFAPPLGECTTPPGHWPKDLKICPLPRISWLPPGWGQAIRVGKQGRRYKVFVAPKEHGSLVVNSKQSMEVVLQSRPRALDQHGKPLRLQDACIERWPQWLPRDWRIAYFKEEGAVKPCFLCPEGGQFLQKEAVFARMRELRAQRRAEEAQAQKDKLKKRRLRPCRDVVDDADIGEVQQRAESSSVEPAGIQMRQSEAAEPVALQQADPTALADERHETSRRRKRQLASGPQRCCFDLSKLSDDDREWLTKHPLYDKIHRRGYPLPFGDQEILALRAFTPRELGGTADLSFC